jgi:hypothetical protein
MQAIKDFLKNNQQAITLGLILVAGMMARAAVDSATMQRSNADLKETMSNANC